MACDMWHVTHDMWHVTHDMWHVTCDTWPVTCDMLWGVNILSKFQLPSSYGLWFMILWIFGEKAEWLTDWMNEWINYEGVCRTAPATPGLLNTGKVKIQGKRLLAKLVYEMPSCILHLERILNIWKITKLAKLDTFSEEVGRQEVCASFWGQFLGETFSFFWLAANQH